MSRDHTQESHRAPNGGTVSPLDEPKSVRAQASAWLAKLDCEEPSEASLQAFKQWVNQDPSHILAFEKAAAAWEELNILTRLPSLLQQQSLQQQRQTPPHSAQGASLGKGFIWANVRRHASHLVWQYTAVAATLMVGLMFLLSARYEVPQQAIYTTAVGEQKILTLPDNSVVQLNTNSRVAFDYRGEVRAVYLYRGEVHFTVAKNPERPFEVYAGAGLVRAVGTAFTVALNEESNEVDVLVTEGVVEIAPEIPPPSVASAASTSAVGEARPTDQAGPDSVHNTEPGAQRVSAGSAAVYDRVEVRTIEKLRAEELQQRVAWQQGLLIFSGDTLAEVVKEISRYTDTKIIIKSEAASEMRIGGQFRVNDTRAIFGALEQGFGLKAEYATNSLVYLSYQNPSRE